MSTFKSLTQELREKGAGNRDIGMALRVMVAISALDELVFSKKERGMINIIPASKHPHKYPVAYHRGDKESEECYLIFVNGIADYLKEEKSKKRVIIKNGRPGNRAKLVKNSWDEMFFRVAAHEVRHRLQNKLKIRKFTPKSAEIIDDRILKWTIEFYTVEFEERKKIYERDGESEDYIRDRMKPREFDASVIESFVISKIRGNGGKISLNKKIASLIKTERPRR
ncbi:MAG: hypothetical protein WC919_04905 [Candidatus Paceibacterota bacterium]